MSWSFIFFFNSFLLGIGLAADAVSVSLADGFHEPSMKKTKMGIIALTFAIFQFVMPILGFIFVHTILQQFEIFEYFIPWIALILLSFIGGKMVYGFFKSEEIVTQPKLKFSTLIVQGIATSIDALSVGFTIATYDINHALVCGLIIGLTTFILSFCGVFLGKKIGTKLSNKAELIGGIILIAIGIEIFITGLIGLYS